MPEWKGEAATMALNFDALKRAADESDQRNKLKVPPPAAAIGTMPAEGNA